MSKKNLVIIIVIEGVLLVCAITNNYYRSNIILHGSLGPLDWIYMNITFPLQYIAVAGLLSVPVFLVASMVFGNKLQFVHRAAVVILIWMISLSTPGLVMPNVNQMIYVYTSMGIIISGIMFMITDEH